MSKIKIKIKSMIMSKRTPDPPGSGQIPSP